MFVVEGLRIEYAGLVAVDGFDIAVAEGEAAGLIGANGAGKSSAINGMAGAIRSAAGSVKLDGQELRGLPSYAVARAGLGRTFQQARLWPKLTIRENLTLVPRRKGARTTGLSVDTGAEQLGLTGLLDAQASTISYGSRRLVEVLRAVLIGARLILLDEPAAGLSPRDKTLLADFLASLRREGLATLIVDHDMSFVRQTCAQLHVLQSGRFLAKGTPEEVFAMPAVRESYLGGDFAHD